MIIMTIITITIIISQLCSSRNHSQQNTICSSKMTMTRSLPIPTDFLCWRQIDFVMDCLLNCGKTYPKRIRNNLIIYMKLKVSKTHHALRYSCRDIWIHSALSVPFSMRIWEEIICCLSWHSVYVLPIKVSCSLKSHFLLHQISMSMNAHSISIFLLNAILVCQNVCICVYVCRVSNANFA